MSAVVTFDRGFERQRGSARRYAIAATIVAAHVGFIALFASGSTVLESERNPIPMRVAFLEQASEPEAAPTPEPKLVSVSPVAVNVPQVALPVEVEPPAVDAASTVVVPVPGATSPAISDSRGPPQLSDVAYVKPPMPRYPSESRRAHEQGLVLLRVLIDESGHARVVDVYRSSGHPRLDDAARDAVQRALFKPYLDGGVPRAAIAVVPIEFSLHT